MRQVCYENESKSTGELYDRNISSQNSSGIPLKATTLKDENESAKILSFSEWKGMRVNNSDDDFNDDDNDTTDLDQMPVWNSDDHNVTYYHHSYQNYASKDCGARIISSNPESSHASDILNQDLDAYALNPCYVLDQNGNQKRTNIYFIVQLCEKISIRSYSFVNVEIYSSNPKMVRFLYSPSSDAQGSHNEWHDAGTSIANDSKDMQTFELNKPTHFTKIVKIEFLEYYDNEPHCPLTTFQVYGTSFIDKLTFKPSFNIRQSETNPAETPPHSPYTNIHPVHYSQTDFKKMLSSVVSFLVSNCKKIAFYGKVRDQIQPEQKYPTVLEEKNAPIKQITSFKSNSSEVDILPESYSSYSVQQLNLDCCSFNQFQEYQAICLNLSLICFSNNLLSIYDNLYTDICPYFIKKLPPATTIAAMVESNIKNDVPESLESIPEHVTDFDPSTINTIHAIKIKLRDLKKNLSLTTKYLEEVSVKFREAINDLRKSTIVKVNILEKNQKEIISSMEIVINTLTEQNERLYLAFSQIHSLIESINKQTPFIHLSTYFLLVNAVITQAYFIYLVSITVTFDDIRSYVKRAFMRLKYFSLGGPHYKQDECKTFSTKIAENSYHLLSKKSTPIIKNVYSPKNMASH
ncbi:hypothetical protein MXB_4900 [Myxobolus squamalis]|nr:hypothetical protein MXB_4900 [Myxobolus squamalis]